MNANDDFTLRDEANAITACFTEQPLWAFAQSCRTLPNKYSPYALAVRKANLFEYGGRPVIYGDENLLARLRSDDKYLWVHYNPIPEDRFRSYPLDWTHEREWRARVGRYHYLSWGSAPKSGVPLILPPTAPDYDIRLPVVIVKTKAQAEALRSWLARPRKYSGGNGYLRKFFECREHLPVVSLEMVAEELAEGGEEWRRLDTSPIPYTVPDN